jgi:hypothetical protein
MCVRDFRPAGLQMDAGIAHRAGSGEWAQEAARGPERSGELGLGGRPLTGPGPQESGQQQDFSTTYFSVRLFTDITRIAFQRKKPLCRNDYIACAVARALHLHGPAGML